MFFAQTDHLVSPVRWPNSSQPEMAKPDWYQRVTID